MEAKPGLEEEAQAFNQRILERTRAGYIPDLRRATKCEFFYKSFWRDPYFIQKYLGDVVENLLAMVATHTGPGSRILDVGCGAGYISLELARAGHHVLGIDIAADAIASARRTLESNPYKDGFGSLAYEVRAVHEATGTYDVVLYSGLLHHLEKPDETVEEGVALLRANGIVIAYEPCHEEWRMQDAAQVALIRALLSLTGFWYEPTLGADARNTPEALRRLTADIHDEYVEERDKHEKEGQSPHDNSSGGKEILEALRKYTDELEFRPAFSFVYRLLGGLRGPDDAVYKIADLLTTYDKFATHEGFLKPNIFYFAGRKRLTSG
jgi:2-polyprenyl-3-methyl-5-hydroxy-6-metoxy-1,4-benzoquinol methylase